jgi:hypothetical protein
MVCSLTMHGRGWARRLVPSPRYPNRRELHVGAARRDMLGSRALNARCVVTGAGCVIANASDRSRMPLIARRSNAEAAACRHKSTRNHGCGGNAWQVTLVYGFNRYLLSKPDGHVSSSISNVCIMRQR